MEGVSKIDILTRNGARGAGFFPSQAVSIDLDRQSSGKLEY